MSPDIDEDEESSMVEDYKRGIFQGKYPECDL